MSAEAPERAAREEPIRVLHVDDDPSVLELTADFLRREAPRFEVTSAEAVPRALELLDSEAIDCVVSDFDLQGANGLEFLAAVRERDGELPFVLFTGKGSEEIASEAISAGVTDYLQKGSGRDQYAMLANRVENAVERHRALDALREERRRYELVARASADAFWDYDPQTGAVERSDGFQRVFGYDPEEVEEDREWWQARIHPADRERATAAIDRAVEGPEEEFEVEYRLQRGDGSYTRVRSHGFVVVEDGEPVRVIGVVTELSDAEDRAYELERYATILEATGDPVYALDATGRYTFLNEAHTDLLGYEVEELLGEHVSTIAAEGDVERVQALIRELLRDDDRRHGTIELTLVTDAGERVPVENHLALLTDEDGGFRGTAGILRDLREREERERVLEALHEATRGLIRAESPEAVAELTAEAAEEVLGYVENTVRLIEDGDRLVPEAMTSAMRSRLGERPVYRVGQEPVGLAYSRGEPLVYDDALTLEDDVERSSGANLYVPIGRYGVMTVTDHEVGSLDESDVRLASILAANAAAALERIEEMEVRREQEAELRERQRSLEALHDATRRLLAADSKAEAASIVAETAKDVLGYPVSSVRLVSEDGQQLVPVASVGLDASEREPYPVDEGPSGQVLQSGESAVFDDLSVFGSEHGAGLSSMLVMPLSEHGAFAVGDAGEGAFDESERQLAAVLAANMTAVLDRIEQARGLERQNERLESFASVLSHDLRNPLNVAGGRLELARETGDAAEFDRVEQALLRMGEIIDDVLSLARVGQTVVEPDTVDLRSCVEGAWRSLATDDASLVPEEDLGTIDADRSRLRQLFENLFANAVEHGGPGVTVRVGRLPDETTGFYVADDGPGIPAEEREAVFESGYTTDSDGTGFGLAIVEGIAEAHGWEVTVGESADGGARFEVRGVGDVGDD